MGIRTVLRSIKPVARSVLARAVRRAAGLMLFAATASLATAAPGRADPVTVKDAGGRSVTVKDSSRIVSVGGSITEILYTLGLERRIIGVDSSSVYPPQAMKEKPSVGYMRQLSPEGVLGLNPSLTLATEDSGPKDTIQILETAGVPFVLVPERFSGDGILEKIRVIGLATGATGPAECLTQKVKADLDAVARLRGRVGKPMRAAFVLSFAGGRAMLAGRDTAADGIIRLAGGVNVVTEYTGYKAVNDEALVALAPEFVVAMSRDGLALEARTVFGNPAFALTPAAKRQSFVVLEGLYLLGFGPRTALAARDLAASFYPALAAEKLPSELTDAGACPR